MKLFRKTWPPQWYSLTIAREVKSLQQILKTRWLQWRRNSEAFRFGRVQVLVYDCCIFPFTKEFGNAWTVKIWNPTRCFISFHFWSDKKSKFSIRLKIRTGCCTYIWHVNLKKKQKKTTQWTHHFVPTCFVLKKRDVLVLGIKITNSQRSTASVSFSKYFNTETFFLELEARIPAEVWKLEQYYLLSGNEINYIWRSFQRHINHLPKVIPSLLIWRKLPYKSTLIPCNRCKCKIGKNICRCDARVKF